MEDGKQKIECSVEIGRSDRKRLGNHLLTSTFNLLSFNQAVCMSLLIKHAIIVTVILSLDQKHKLAFGWVGSKMLQHFLGGFLFDFLELLGQFTRANDRWII